MRTTPRPLRVLATMVLALGSAPGAAHAQTALLRADRVLDGLGGELSEPAVLVEGDRIVAVGQNALRRAGDADLVYDLSGATLLPGLIDTHVHLSWHFDRETGRLHTSREETDAQAALYMVENANAMLGAGFTTVQSLGSPEEADVRDWAERGGFAAPRILTSLSPLSARTGDPDALRAAVRARAEAGADVIKIFASESIRTGGAPTLSQDQLNAACGEAADLGLRTAVHAHGPESVRRAALAGCTTIEHGALLDRPTLELLAERGTYYDPNIHLIFQNYFDNRDRYLGIGGYTEEGFQAMEAAVPRALAAFREALTVPGLSVVFGTDAVAGAHGRQAEELIYRVQVGGQPAGDAIVSATSLSARSLGLDDRLGSVAAGLAADLVAVDGDPLADIETLRRVRFVMVRGRVWRNEPPPR